MRFIILAFLPCLAIFLQSTLFNAYSVGGTIPDMVLIFVIFFALFNGDRQGLAYGFLCGFLEDLYTGRLIGINALTKGIIGFIMGRIQGIVFKENLLVGVLGVLLGTILNSILLLFFYCLAQGGLNFDESLWVMLLYQGVYNLILAAPIYIWFYHSSRKGILNSAGERDIETW